MNYINRMSKRERILAALNNQEVDRVPWSPLIDNYFISSLPLQGKSMNIIEAMRYIGNDIIERHVATPFVQCQNIVFRSEERNGVIRECIETPVGSIFQEKKLSGGTDFVVKHYIETLEDMKIYQYVAEHTDYVPRIQECIDRNEYIGEDGIAIPSGMHTPIQDLLQYQCGVENTVYLMCDYPDEMDELLEVMQERNIRQYKKLVDYPVPLVISYEDTSSTVISPWLYEEYCAPMINEYTRLMHDSGKIFITHMCGRLTAFKDMIREGEQDGIDSVCPPDTGDLCIWDASKYWGHNKILIGGLDPSTFSRMTEEQSVRKVKEIMEMMPDLKGFILSTGDAVAYGTPIENLKAITDYLNGCF